jgi:hypothetical protein
VKVWQRNGILIAAVLALGAARMPFEAALAKDLRAAKLTPPPLEIGTRDKIGQTSSAVALGGLRTLVATFLNLRAFGFFEENKWDKVADTFETIVDLAPHSAYYWDTGSWYSAFCAASYYRNDTSMPALRRREAWRDSIHRGKAFLERGIRNNPEDPTLLSAMGALLSSEYRFPAFQDLDKTFAEAAEYYRRAADTGRALGFVRRAQFIALARVSGKEKEALALARSLYADPTNRVPTLVTLLLVLEAYENPSMDTGKRAVEIFGTPEIAYRALSAHWQWTSQRYPVYGVASALRSLEKTLAIPAEESIFSRPLQAPKGPDDWFSE